jgi:hypothetical protein
MILINCIGSIIGYFMNDIIINSNNIYINKLLKYISIFGFQNIMSKLVLSEFTIFNIQNIARYNFYVLIYFFIDILIYIHINSKYKNMFIDITKVSLGVIIIETLLQNKLNINNYISILILIIANYIYYNKIYHYIKQKLKR